MRSSLASLAPEEYSDLSEVLRRAIEIVKTVLNPGGVNLGMNLGKCAGAGIEDHLHWHIVPRWEGDTNFMPVIGETRVMPQHLARQLRPAAAAFSQSDGLSVFERRGSLALPSNK